ncbi:hypothetical protein GALL_532650 [mine drainage metagenome]|uniref:Uncharacterized protein n=1 Tax=mine drainage metagenome TaxID=410659 RepID=A0A1J5PIS4_9ZZZZ
MYVLAAGWYAKHVFMWEDTAGNGLNSLKRLDPDGVDGVVYKLPLSGPCLIQQSCLQNNENNSGNRELALDGNQALTVPQSQFKFIVYPDFQGTLRDAPLVIRAKDINELLGGVTEEQRPEYCDHEHWPFELNIALTAWLAVVDQKEPGKSPKQLLTAWIEKNNNYIPKLTKSQIARIAMVANWDKNPGPKSKSS